MRALLDDQLAATLPEDRERDLVAHRRGRQVHRLLVPEELGGTALELEDGGILALLLVPHLGGRHRLAHRGRRLRRGVGAEIDHGRVRLASKTERSLKYVEGLRLVEDLVIR